MSFQLPTVESRASANAQPRWSGAAVLVESMLLLVFLIASLAVFTQMFSASMSRAEQSSSLTAAVAAASDAAERFAAYPAQAGGVEEVDGLRVVCDVQAESHASGTLYRATISVYAADGEAGTAGAEGAGEGAARDAQGNALESIYDEPIYSISTSRFESEVE